MKRSRRLLAEILMSLFTVLGVLLLQRGVQDWGIGVALWACRSGGTCPSSATVSTEQSLRTPR